MKLQTRTMMIWIVWIVINRTKTALAKQKKHALFVMVQKLTISPKNSKLMRNEQMTIAWRAIIENILESTQNLDQQGSHSKKYQI